MGGMQRTVGKTGAFLAKQGNSMQFGTFCEETGKSLQLVKKQGDAIKQQNGQFNVVQVKKQGNALR